MASSAGTTRDAFEAAWDTATTVAQRRRAVLKLNVVSALDDLECEATNVLKAPIATRGRQAALDRKAQRMARSSLAAIAQCRTAIDVGDAFAAAHWMHLATIQSEKAIGDRWRALDADTGREVREQRKSAGRKGGKSPRRLRRKSNKQAVARAAKLLINREGRRLPKVEIAEKLSHERFGGRRLSPTYLLKLLEGVTIA